MGLKIKKAEVIIGDKKKVIFAKDVVEMGFIGPGGLAVDHGEGPAFALLCYPLAHLPQTLALQTVPMVCCY